MAGGWGIAISGTRDDATSLLAISSAVQVNQEESGGQWNLLGEYDMAPGQSHRIVVSDAGAEGKVIADAVRLELW